MLPYSTVSRCIPVARAAAGGGAHGRERGHAHVEGGGSQRLRDVEEAASQAQMATAKARVALERQVGCPPPQQWVAGVNSKAMERAQGARQGSRGEAQGQAADPPTGQGRGSFAPRIVSRGAVFYAASCASLCSCCGGCPCGKGQHGPALFRSGLATLDAQDACPLGGQDRLAQMKPSLAAQGRTRPSCARRKGREKESPVPASAGQTCRSKQDAVACSSSSRRGIVRYVVARRIPDTELPNE